MLSTQERQRYLRHLSMPQIGQAGQETLKQAKVLCIGAGGLGCPNLLYLAAAGVGTIGVIDHDQVELSNLHRQVLFSPQDMGQPKALVAQKKLSAQFPDIKIEAYAEEVTAHNACELVKHYDVIIDGSDNFHTRYLVNDACFYAGKPHVHASVFQFQGQCAVLTAKHSVCYRCLYPEPPPREWAPSCAEAGVLGVLPGILGTLQATEAIKLLLGLGKPLIDTLLTVDALNMRFNKITIEKRPDCRLCAQRLPFDALPYHAESISAYEEDQISVTAFQRLRQQRIPHLLLDVREPFEYDICHLNGKLVPLGDLPHCIDQLDPHLLTVVQCRSGHRSQQAVELLKSHGFEHVKNLQGGILAWIDQIDSSLPRY